MKVALVVLLGAVLAACNGEEAARPNHAERAGPNWSVEGPVVAQVGDWFISRPLFEGYLRLRGQADGDPVARQQVLDELIDLHILVQQAADQGVLDQALKVELELQRLNAIGNRVYAAQAREHAISDQAVEAEYQRQVARGSNREFLLRHILVPEQQQAAQIAERLIAGESFAALQAEYVEVVGAANSGTLGWVNLTQVPPAFGPALSAVEPGQYTAEPVSSDYGWHIIQVDDVREFSPPPLEEVEEGIRATLQAQRWEQYVAELRTKAVVKRHGRPQSSP